MGRIFNRRRASLLRDAFELSVLYLPVFALSRLAELLLPFDSGIFVFSLLVGLLCFCAAVSESSKVALIKIGLSVPFTLAWWLIFAFTDFDARLLNTIYPGYGVSSAGGGFASMVRFASISISHGAAELLAVFLSSAVDSRAQRLHFAIQGIVLPAICSLVFLAVLYLGLTMPSWESIYRSVYS